MVVRLSALRTGRTLLSRTLLFLCFWYSFLLETEEGLSKFKKKSPHRESNPRSAGLKQSALTTTLNPKFYTIVHNTEPLDSGPNQVLKSCPYRFICCHDSNDLKYPTNGKVRNQFLLFRQTCPHTWAQRLFT
jgi:hypothetical protein